MAMRKTVRSRRLGKQLRRLRDEQQLNQEAVVDAVNAENDETHRLSKAHLSRVETGLARVTPEQLDSLLALFDVSSEERSALHELRRRAGERGWWAEYADLVSEDVEMLIELGEDATTARSYDTAFVQGLLQTRRYAEAVVAAGRAFVAPIDVDRMVDMRLRRQKRLAEPSFHGLSAVMTESVIRTVVGGPTVMREQLEYLLDVGRQLPVTIHVLPFSAGALPGADNFVLFGFDHDEDGDVVYVDSDTAQRAYEDRMAVRRCTYTYDAALAQALTQRESEALIRTVLKEL